MRHRRVTRSLDATPFDQKAPLKKTLVTAALVAFAVLAIATPASAHNVVVDSSPAADSTVTELPAAFSVTTAEPMLTLGADNNGFALQVTDAAGRFYGDGCLTVTGSTMATGATLGEPGAYTLTWQIVSEDGHAASGSFGFTWAPAPDAPRTEGAATPPSCQPVVEEPTATPTPAPTAVDTAGPSHAEDSGTADLPLATVLWIGGGVLLAAIVITIVLLVARRRGSPPVE
jgi:methionine-rich copper-binding protein CopC